MKLGERKEHEKYEEMCRCDEKIERREKASRTNIVVSHTSKMVYVLVRGEGRQNKEERCQMEGGRGGKRINKRENRYKISKEKHRSFVHEKKEGDIMYARAELYICGNSYSKKMKKKGRKRC